MDAASHSIFEGSPENEKEIMMTMIITDQSSSCYFSSYYVARPLRSPFPPSVSPLCAQASGGRVHERHHHQGEVEEVPAGLGPLPQTWERNASISKGSRSLISSWQIWQNVSNLLIF